MHHDASLYGADRSLIGVLDVFRAAGLIPIVVVPYRGDLVSEIQSRGYEIHLGPIAKLERRNASLFGLFRLARELVVSMRFLKRILSGRDVSLVYSNSIAVLSGGLFARLNDLPHLQHVREIVSEPKLFAQWFPRWLSYSADWCVCNSKATQEWIVGGATKLGRRSSVVWNGFRPKAPAERHAVQAFRKSLGLADDDVLVTVVGRINWWKGQRVFIDAVAQLRAEGGVHRGRFVIVGDPPAGQEQLLESLKTTVQSNALESLVTFRSFTPDIDTVWAATDIAVVPSEEPEPFGRVAIEAMSYGVPVVASDIGGLSEIVQHQESGLLVKAGDTAALAEALGRLLGSHDERRRLGEAGRLRHAQYFTQEVHDAQFLGVVRQMLRLEERPVVLMVHQASELYGSDRVLLNLARELKRRGPFDPVVVVPNDGPLLQELSAAGVEVHVLEVAKVSRRTLRPVGLIKLMIALQKSSRAIGEAADGRTISIVHSNTLAVFGGAFWAHRHKVPHVWHVHEIIDRPRLASWGFTMVVAATADAVIANSTATRDWLVKSQPDLSARCSVVFNGLPAIARSSEEAERNFRESLGLHPKTVLVTLAGRINRWKGQGLLVDAVRLLKGTGAAQGARFLIIGDVAPGQEHLRLHLQEAIERYRLQDDVLLHGFVDDMGPIWGATQIAVVPSTDPEPFGMVAIEAMAASVPVVAAAHGGLLDIVGHGVTGLLFKPGDATELANALKCLIEDEELRTAFGKAGCERQMATFGLDAQVLATEAIYRRVAR